MLNVHSLGMKPYLMVWEDMKRFTSERDHTTPDELWLLEHPSVYTLGQAGLATHILNPSDIPVIQSDRGGQVTYHGPGQLVCYVLMDIRRRHLGIRTLVSKLEQLLISLLASYKIAAETRCGAPGVYIGEKKIASIGLRVKNGCTYHGIALNITTDLRPFANINPCGYKELQMTNMADFIPDIDLETVSVAFINEFISVFSEAI